MARLKKSITKDIQKAQQRLDGAKAISPTLDLGEGVTVAAFKESVDLPINLITTYNSLLAQADETLNQINQAINAMGSMSGRVMDGIKFKFGADSNEYEMAGGTRKSERKKPVRKLTANP